MHCFGPLWVAARQYYDFHRPQLSAVKTLKNLSAEKKKEKKKTQFDQSYKLWRSLIMHGPIPQTSQMKSLKAWPGKTFPTIFILQISLHLITAMFLCLHKKFERLVLKTHEKRRTSLHMCFFSQS